MFLFSIPVFAETYGESALYDLYDNPSLLGEYDSLTKRICLDENGYMIIQTSATDSTLSNESYYNALSDLFRNETMLGEYNGNAICIKVDNNGSLVGSFE